MAIDNNVNLVGNLVADPELRFTKGGTAVAELRMAVNRRLNKDGEWQEETSFFDVSVWSEMAEHVAESLTKGLRVVFTGRVEEQRWEDKETKEPRRKVVVIADEVAPSLRWVTVDVHKESTGKTGAKAPAMKEEEPF